MATFRKEPKVASLRQSLRQTLHLSGKQRKLRNSKKEKWEEVAAFENENEDDDDSNDSRGGRELLVTQKNARRGAQKTAV